jgi:hypothetical protein
MRLNSVLTDQPPPRRETVVTKYEDGRWYDPLRVTTGRAQLALLPPQHTHH